MSNHLLHSDIFLHVSPDKFFFESKSNLLIIDRVTNEISLEDDRGQLANDFLSSRQSVSGIIGIIDIVSGPALIVAKQRKKIGDITSENHGIYQIAEWEVLPFAKTDNHLTRGQKEDNDVMLYMINQVLQTPNFYFSLSCDLTRSVQKKWESAFGPKVAKKDFNDSTTNLADVISLFTEWDTRFVWNLALLQRFISSGAEFLPFCLPITHGAVFIRQCSLNGKLFRYSVISRRSVRKPGTRFFARGCDESGNCANFVETEQIVESSDCLASFVQTRGSIPFFWSQLPDMIHYKPDPVIENSKRHLDGFLKHFSEQMQVYGTQIIINLIDHRKGEGNLETHFRSLHQTSGLPGVQYLAFDFHQNCANFKWDKLHSLILDLRPKLEQSSFFLIKDKIITQRQSGVFRTNCMDCLDRTNVVQSLISTEFLQDALTSMNVLNDAQRLNHMHQFHDVFRNLWADHGDLLSVQYAGTPALKTDFTRTGKRTFKGMLSDLRNSVVRYYKNNFTDGLRQDAIELFLGLYRPNPNSISQYGQGNVNTWLTYIPLVFIFGLAMVLLTLILVPEYDQDVALFLLFWLFFTCGVGAVIYKNAINYVNFPKFTKVTL